MAVLEALVCLAPSGGRRPHRSSTEVETEHRQSHPLVIHAGQLTSLRGQLQRPLPLSDPGRTGVESERFPLTASARLCNPS
jgi:hypothetical protein